MNAYSFTLKHIIILLCLGFLTNQTLLSQCGETFAVECGNPLSGSYCYDNNDNCIITFCPDTPGAFAVLTVDVGVVEVSYDQFNVYFGNSASGNPDIGLTGTVTGNVITSQSPDGCITIQVLSDVVASCATGEISSDIQYTVSCEIPCVPPNASFTVNSEQQCAAAAMGNNGPISFDASGSSGAASYEWNFGDGTTGSGVTIDHTFPDGGGYLVVLTTNPAGEDCPSMTEAFIQIASPPSSGLNIQGEWVDQDAGTFCPGGGIAIISNPIAAPEWTPVPLDVSAELGSGGEDWGLETGVTVTIEVEATPGSTVADGSEMEVCLDMSHEWFTDTEIILQCPDGTQVTLLEYEDWTLGNVDLNGNTYCFTMSASQTMLEAQSSLTGPVLPDGDYLPFEDFDVFTGCPFDGTWTLIFNDYFPTIDDGNVTDAVISFGSGELSLLVEPFEVGIASVAVELDGANIEWTNTGTSYQYINAVPEAPGDYTYTVVVTDDFGCTYEEYVNVTVLSFDEAECVQPCPPSIPATASNNGPYCSDDSPSIELLGETTAEGTTITYSWTGPSGYASNQQNPTDATMAGVYTLVVTVDDCVSEGYTTEVIFNDPVIISVSSEVCMGEELTLPDGTVVTVNSDNVYTEVPTGLLAVNGCDSLVTVNVTVLSLPTVNLDPNVEVCGSSDILDLSSYPVDPPDGAWSIGNDGSNPPLSADDLMQTGLSDGDQFYYQGIGGNGCISGAVLTVSVADAPEITLGASACEDADNFSIEVSIAPAGVNYNVSITPVATGFPTTLDGNTTNISVPNGTYTITVTDPNGAMCSVNSEEFTNPICPCPSTTGIGGTSYACVSGVFNQNDIISTITLENNNGNPVVFFTDITDPINPTGQYNGEMLSAFIPDLMCVSESLSMHAYIECDDDGDATTPNTLVNLNYTHTIEVYPSDISSLITSETSTDGCTATVNIDPLCGANVSASDGGSFTADAGTMGDATFIITYTYPAELEGNECIVPFDIAVPYNCPSACLTTLTSPAVNGGVTICDNGTATIDLSAIQNTITTDLDDSAIFIWTNETTGTIVDNSILTAVPIAHSGSGCTTESTEFSLEIDCTTNSDLNLNGGIYTVTVYPQVTASMFTTPVGDDCMVEITDNCMPTTLNIQYSTDGGATYSAVPPEAPEAGETTDYTYKITLLGIPTAIEENCGLIALQSVSCPDISGCTSMTACNYDATATVDDGSCQEPDCEGVCDGMATGPAIAGTTCDDGNAATANDVWTSDCVCIGGEIPGCMSMTACNYDATATVDDGSCQEPDCEGVCDGMATGPAIAGTMCDDGDPTTVGEVYDTDCNCVGNPILGCTSMTACNYDATATVDDDSCQEPDCENNCDGMATGPAIAGTMCDDGDPTTVGEVYDGACNCVGNPILGCTSMTACNYDATATVDDGMCNEPDCENNCDGMATGPAVAESTCDDGDPNTEGDVWTIDCNCEGSNNFDCPILGLNIGDLCDDNDDFTINDEVTSDCECLGCPIPFVTFDDDLIITPELPSPTTIYCGEDYEFCIDITNWVNLAENSVGLLAIEPSFSVDSWDATSYDAIGQPISCDGTGIWVWQDGLWLYDAPDNQGDDFVGDACTDFCFALSTLDCSTPNYIGSEISIEINYAIDSVAVGPFLSGCSIMEQDTLGPWTVICPDMDEDGFCAEDDCDDEDPFLPVSSDTACDDGDPSTVNDYIQAGDCLCEGEPLQGCTDMTACNYDPLAIIDDGSCLDLDCEGICGGGAGPGTPCDDGDPTTINDTYDGICDCIGITVPGCTDIIACNYDPMATIDNATCTYPDCEGICDGAASPGSPCDDGDPTTANDIWTIDCDCIGDGIPGCTDMIACNYDPTATIDNASCNYPDCEDNCDGLGSGPAQIGSPCDDGDPVTVGDTYDASCICSGNPTLGCTDMTACNYDPIATLDDGLCNLPDCEGNCDGMVTGPAIAGASCDDGDPTTVGEAYDINCNCIGDPILGCMSMTACNYDATATVDDASCQEPDCEGICDGMVTGPAIAGASCDDGDPTTVGEAYDINCNCIGDPILGCMSMTACNYDVAATIDDGSCLQPDCEGVCDGMVTGPAIAGTACDDGDATTGEDTYDTNCNCIGTPIIAGCDYTTAGSFDIPTTTDINEGEFATLPTFNGVTDLPSVEYVLSNPQDLVSGEPNVVAALGSNSTLIDPVNYGFVGGDQFCVTAVAYNIVLVQNMIDAINPTDPTNTCCDVLTGVIGTDVCGDLCQNTEICEGADIMNFQQVIDVFGAFGGETTINSTLSNIDAFNQTIVDNSATLPTVCPGLQELFPLCAVTSNTICYTINIVGCTDATACNYNADAVVDDNSCVAADCEGNCDGEATGPAITGTTCDDGDANTINDMWDIDCNCTGAPCNDVSINVSNDGPVCEGTTINLTAGDVPNGIYSWTGPNGFVSSDQNPMATDGGIYELTVELDGCFSTPTQTEVIVNPVPVISIAATGSTEACPEETIGLVASVPADYISITWSGGSGSITPITANDYTNIEYIPGLTDNGSTILTLSVETTCGTVTDEIEIVINVPDVQLDIANNEIEVCEGEEIMLEAQSNSNITWQSLGGGDFTNMNGLATQYNPDLEDIGETVQMLVTANDPNCPDYSVQDTVIVTIKPNIEVFAGLDSTINFGEAIMLQATGDDSENYEWSPPDYLDCITCPETMATPPDTKTYVLTSSTKCSNSDEITIYVVKDFKILVPNAFSPNNDGNNDVFRAMGNGFIVEELQVFNRYGDLLYKGLGDNASWDGFFAGEPQEIGVYLFSITYRSVFDQKTDKISGNVTLIR